MQRALNRVPFVICVSHNTPTTQKGYLNGILFTRVDTDTPRKRGPCQNLAPSKVVRHMATEPPCGSSHNAPHHQKGHRSGVLFGGGRGWIRTTEVADGRFTVCSLWPLGNPSVY